MLRGCSLCKLGRLLTGSPDWPPELRSPSVAQTAACVHTPPGGTVPSQVPNLEGLHNCYLSAYNSPVANVPARVTRHFRHTSQQRCTSHRASAFHFVCLHNPRLLQSRRHATHCDNKLTSQIRPRVVPALNYAQDIQDVWRWSLSTLYGYG